jgi:hypothetical protein
VRSTPFPEIPWTGRVESYRCGNDNFRGLRDVERNMSALILRNSHGDKDVAKQVEKKTADELTDIVLQNIKSGDPREFWLQCRFFPKVLAAMSMETRFAADLKMMRDHPVK